MVSLGQLSHAQLNTSIERIAARAQGKVVGVSCSLPGTPLACDLNAAARLPMQSVYKLPIAMTVLHEVDEGRLSLSQKARFLPGDVISPRQYSPLRDAHPNGGVDVAIKELLRLTVEESDGVASDILLRTIGGPKAADAYIRSLGIDGIHIADPERTLARDVTAQYRNYAEPRALVALLRLLADGSPLSPANTELLLRWMTETPTGEHRIPGSLPNDVTVAHKTGTSGEDRGVTHATNDVGLITLPGGKMLALAILIEDSPESEDVREGVIAEIARAIWAQAVNATAQKEEHGSNARAAVMRAHVQ
ncbi:MAG TPA: class A beta-lactamase [Terracidiphilus sp.]|nr:class A beta-lactamase [Terracidiphilus sp.]